MELIPRRTAGLKVARHGSCAVHVLLTNVEVWRGPFQAASAGGRWASRCGRGADGFYGSGRQVVAWLRACCLSACLSVGLSVGLSSLSHFLLKFFIDVFCLVSFLLQCVVCVFSHHTRTPAHSLQHGWTCTLIGLASLRFFEGSHELASLPQLCCLDVFA